MQKYNAREVTDCYNRTAKEYAEQFLNELDNNPFDRNILNRFNDMLPNGSLILYVDIEGHCWQWRIPFRSEGVR